MRSRGNSGSCWDVSSTWAADVMTQVRSGDDWASMRSRACCKSVRVPRGEKLLGSLRPAARPEPRPPPPAMMTAWSMVNPSRITSGTSVRQCAAACRPPWQPAPPRPGQTGADLQWHGARPPPSARHRTPTSPTIPLPGRSSPASPSARVGPVAFFRGENSSACVVSIAAHDPLQRRRRK
jgi:hypothetical protein